MKTYLIYIVGSLIAYLIGSISTSLIISKIKNKDLRAGGSKNLGASNTTLLMGWKYGVIVGVCDILKGTLVVVLARLLFADCIYLPYVVGTAAVLGHIYPFYLKFKGGKGVLTSLAMTLMLDWRASLIALAVFVVILLLTRYVSVSSMIAAICDATLIYVFQPLNPVSYIPAFIAAALIIVKHKANIKRLIKGEESKIF